MSYTKLRTLSVLASLAVIAGAAGFSSFAAADTGGPTVVLSTTASSTTNMSSVPVTATFSEDVSAPATSSFDITNASVSDLSGSGAVYTFTLSPTAQGAFSVMFPADIATSTDASSTGSQASNTLNFTYDTTAPVISAVSVTPTSTAATITWTTSEAAEGQVSYGTSTAYSASTAMETSFGTSHTATLSGLSASTTYHFQISATDEAGNTATTSDATFITNAVAAAPTVTAIAPTSGTTAGGTSIVITGTGLTGATAVDFGAVSGTITATTSDTSLTVTSPAEAAGAVDVTVVTPNGTSATSSADQFTYVTPTTEPVISDVTASDVGTSTATISWDTDMSVGSGVVNYGTTSAYGSSMSESSTTATTHSVTLTGLSEATLYHFDVQYASSTSADMEFDTESTASTTPLAVNGVTTVQGNATADGTYADGWEWVMHLTVPSVEDAFRMAFSDFTSTGSSSTIPAANDIEIYSPESSNASTSASAITETGSDSYSDWLYLDGDTATTTAGRQIDLYINVAVPLGTAAGTYTTNFAAQSTPSSATSTAQ